MAGIRIRKVVVNIGVGKSGEAVEKASKVIGELTGQKPGLRRARKTIRDFGIRRGEPIGTIVTLRGESVHDLLKRLLSAKDHRLSAEAFDSNGSCSFGIKEHIEIPGVRYSPEVGIFGLNVSVVLERRGFRVMFRQRAPSRVGKRHRISREEAIQYFRDELGVEVA